MEKQTGHVDCSGQQKRVTEDRMRLQFCTSISRVLLPAVAAGVFFAGSQSPLAAAQVQQKKTTEPVFRISKLTELNRDQASANENSNDEFTDSNEIAPTQQALQQSPRFDNGDRIADSSTMPRPTPRISNVVLTNQPNNLPTNIPTPSISAANVKAPLVTPAVLPSASVVPSVTPLKTRAPHPLDRAVSLAETSLTAMRTEVQDYTAILAKREQINGVVVDPSYMNIKVRCPRTQPDGTVTPFSIYMKFLRPTDSQGREVIWVDGRNDGKLSVHEAKGIIRFKTFQLDPTGTLAMRGQRYPIYEAGLENLIVKLIEKADRDRAAGPCTVDYRPAAVNKRPCSLIELVHDERRAPYEFHKAQVYIDDELQLPIRFAAYDWPTSPGATPQLLEEYTYYNVKVNVGLTDMDFSTKNPSYKFPNR